MSNNNDWSPNYGDTQFTKKKHFRFDKDTNTITFRILPQPKGVTFGSTKYKETPFDATWHRYISSIFGFKNSESKFRVFESPQVKNNKTKMIDVPCAATDLINNLKGKLEEAKATNADPAVLSRLNQLVGMKGVYSIDTNQHMNVLLLDGSIGELKLRHKAFLGLKAEIDKLRADGVDPLSLTNGRFFTVTRTVNGRDTLFTPSVYKEKINVEGLGEVEKTYVHSVSDDVLKRLESEGYRLDSILAKLTSEEVGQIVKEADLMTGKSPACDRFFDLRWKAERDARKANSTSSGEDDNGPEEESSPQQAAPTPAPAQAAPTPQAAAPVSAGPTSAPPAAATATPVANTTPVAAQTQETPAPVISELSNADFWKTVGVSI